MICNFLTGDIGSFAIDPGYNNLMINTILELMGTVMETEMRHL